MLLLCTSCVKRVTERRSTAKGKQIRSLTATLKSDPNAGHKKLQNTFKKVLTRGFESGILDKLAKRKAGRAKAQRTLKTA